MQPAAAPQPTSASPRRLEWLFAIGVTAVIALLHLHFFMQRGGIWRDEGDLINLSRLESWRYLLHDSFPALMALLVHGWTWLLGDSDTALKTLGLLIGLGSISALWAAALNARSAPPVFSLVLFGLNSTVISYGDELRAYGLGNLTIICCFTAAWTFLKNASPWRFVMFLLLALLAVQSLFQNAVSLAAICAGAWAVCLRHNQRKTAALYLLVGLIAATSLLPYAYVITTSFTYAQTTGPAAATSFWLIKNFRDVISPLLFDIQFPFDGFAFWWIALAIGLIVLGLARWRVNLRTVSAVEDTDARLFAGVTLAFALPGFIGFFWAVKMIPLFWHYLALLAVTAACFTCLPLPTQRRWQIGTWGLLLGTAIVSAVFAHRDLYTRFTNLDLVAARLKTVSQPGDYVLVTPWYCGITFNRYHHAASDWDTIPPLADHRFHHDDPIREKMRSPTAMQPVLEKIAATLQSGHRVWIVGDIMIPKPATPPPANLPAPPLPNTGWSSLPFIEVWTKQVTHYLRDHSQTFEPVPLGISQPVQFFEDLPLSMAEGWRTDIISPPPVSK